MSEIGYIKDVFPENNITYDYSLDLFEQQGIVHVYRGEFYNVLTIQDHWGECMEVILDFPVILSLVNQLNFILKKEFDDRQCMASKEN